MRKTNASTREVLWLGMRRVRAHSERIALATPGVYMACRYTLSGTFAVVGAESHGGVGSEPAALLASVINRGGVEGGEGALFSRDFFIRSIH